MNFSIKKKNTYPIFSTFAIFLLIISLTLNTQLALGSSPYQSGYDHGCDDVGISNPSDRYINQPEKGPSFHTSEFMNGYNSGFNSCSSSNNNYNEGYSPEGSTSSNSQRDCSLSEGIGGGIGALAGEMIAPGIGGIVTAPIGSNIAKNMCENQ
ncbi:hypothetical protein [Candidatus Nitrosocosmicus arcticus]|uniref:Uncharacterized protein n=1 Tax=Candidatus Nitrosocosmicus arcticus TaxID=2035267 RepID=A0A557SU17_9ARCH|nr:hypothetical protein [Candidatus Nitrosocosmicus arcticus]TVP40085.1 hypothetical protein NARC_100148 [Candidatus Nitrosocosmicus arcticus]